MGGDGYFDREDITAQAYCGYCWKEVWAIGVEFVVDSDSEFSHYICPKCRGTIGGGYIVDFLKAVSAILVVILLCLLIYTCASHKTMRVSKSHSIGTKFPVAIASSSTARSVGYNSSM